MAMALQYAATALHLFLLHSSFSFIATDEVFPANSTFT